MLALLCCMVSTVWAAQKVEIVGLFKGSAVLLVDGKQRLVKQGRTTPEGVTLVEATSRFAVVEVNGKRQRLTLSQRMGSVYSEPELAEVRLPSSDFGHYRAAGTINANAVKFIVDTGASLVALSSFQAQQLGIDFRQGAPMQVSTANGLARGYAVTLDQISVGALSLSNVSAVVIEGPSPQTALLGNSFLSRVNLRVDEGVMVLQSKY